MMSKHLLGRLFHWSGINSFRSFFEKSSHVRILAYHRVLDIDAGYRFDEDLVSASLDDFDRQLRFVKANFTVVPLCDLDTAMRDCDKKERLCVITFDDGFDDIYHNVFPAMKAHGLPATFFVTTDLVGRDDIIWFDWVVRMLKDNSGRRLSVNSGEFSDVIAADTPRRMLDYLKDLPDKKRLETISEIAKELDCTQPATGDSGSRMVSWEMLREMSRHGMEIGSHSCSHALLTRLDHDDIMYELQESKRVIEERLGVECRSFAYPVGGGVGFSRSLVSAVELAGYRYACDYQSGVNESDSLDRYALRRIHVERYIDYPHFCSRLSYPRLFSYYS